VYRYAYTYIIPATGRPVYNTSDGGQHEGVSRLIPNSQAEAGPGGTGHYY